MIDLVAGRLDVMFLNIGSAKSHIDNGSLRGLAVSGTSRAAALPNVPTFHEAGVPLPELDPGTWWGIAAPAGLPAEITAKLNAAVRDALTDPELREKLAKMNVDPIAGTATEFAALIAAETRKWAEVIKRARITVD
jgi:tripartite-type tricarboxylate transporter receptor subunit TctC